jgi:hypothetical protein
VRRYVKDAVLIAIRHPFLKGMSMNETSTITLEKRNIWLRGLLMILMALAYQLAGTVLFFTAIIQFVFAVASDTPNPRLATFGQSVGRFQSQIADFVSFASEDLPFPFADWPSGAK